MDGTTESASTYPAAPPGQLRTARRIDVWGALLAGALYVLGNFYQGPLLPALLGIPATVSAEFLRTSALLHQLGGVALRVPALAMVLLLLARPRGTLRRGFGREPLWVIPLWILGTCVASIVLNSIGLWPFRWRYADDTTIAYARVLISTSQVVALGLWAVVTVFINPLIEEVVFRFGLINIFGGHFRRLSILGSAVLFAGAHLRGWPPWEAQSPDIVNAIWMGVFGVVLGCLASFRTSGLTLPIVVHASRNALELALIFSVARALG